MDASAIGRPAEIQAYADWIAIRQGWAAGRRARALIRPRQDPVRSPAFRAGAGAKAGRRPQRSALPARRRWSGSGKLAGSDDGDRQMAKILAVVLTDGFSPAGADPSSERLIPRTADIGEMITRADSAILDGGLATVERPSRNLPNNI